MALVVLSTVDAVSMLRRLAGKDGKDSSHGSSLAGMPSTPEASSDVTLVVGGIRAARLCAVADMLDARRSQRPSPTVVIETNPSSWPFAEAVLGSVEGGSVAVVLGVARAFSCAQTSGTRLVLTQSLYSLPLWREQLRSRGGTALILEDSEAALRRTAPEALSGRGEWARCGIAHLGPGSAESTASAGESIDAHDVASQLASAFAEGDSVSRLYQCRTIAESHSRNAIARLAFASACMEQAALDDAERELAAAAALAPQWGAVDYERGKLCLRLDRLDLACLAFERATHRLPHFPAAFINLGATLGELDRPQEALAAFRAAERLDPGSPQVVNNVGVTARDLGRLEEAQAAFERLIEMQPHFVFAHYNLGHTLFLQGEFQQAVHAYETGLSRDPERNPIQVARLGFAQLAAGDAEGALRSTREALSRVDGERHSRLVNEALEVEAALRTRTPGLRGLGELRDLLRSVSAPS